MADSRKKRDFFFIPRSSASKEPINKRYVPQVYPRKDYKAHGGVLVSSFARSIEQGLRFSDSNLTSDVLVSVVSPKTVKIKDYRVGLSSMRIHIVKIDPNDQTRATASIQKMDLEFVNQKLSNYASLPNHPNSGILSIIEEIEVNNKQNKIEVKLEDNDKDCIIHLLRHLSFDEKRKVGNRIISYLQLVGKRGSLLIFFEDIFIGVSASINNTIAESIAKEFAFIDYIEEDNKLELSTMRLTSAYVHNITPILIPSNTSSTVRIGIVDTGISKNSPLNQLVKSRITALPPGSTDINPYHGTFVASRAILGDDFQYLLDNGEAVAELCDITVFGIDKYKNPVGPSETLVMRAIEAAAKTDPLIKIFNLSLGFQPINSGRVESLANFLDVVSKKRSLIFTVASGNSAPPHTTIKSASYIDNYRLLSPGESLASITVGSYARRTGPGCSATVNEVSYFSRIGPGFDLGIKPEITLNGGNSALALNPSGAIINSLQVGAGVYGLDENGHVQEDIGTSYAAPVAAHHIAQLINEFPDKSISFYKAMYFHSCSETPKVPNSHISPKNFRGLGIPFLDRIMIQDPSSFILIHEDEIDDSDYQLIPFHVPQIFTRKGKRLGIKVTIVYDPDVNISNPSEYSSSRIQGFIRKPTSMGFRDVALDNKGDNNYQQWSPIISWTGTFDRSFQAGQWQLGLRLYTRFGIASTYKQGYCAVIELFDPHKSTDVLSEIDKDFPLRYTLTPRATG